MNSKKILVDNSENDIVAKAVANSENEKLDILNFVVGAGGRDAFACDMPPDYRAYADSTYVKR